MPYYVCCRGPGYEAVVLTSWAKAREATQKCKGAWTKRYESRAAAAAGLGELLQAQQAQARSCAADVHVGGFAALGRWSACSVFFGEADARNAARDLPAPHTAPRAELAAVLLALERGARDARLCCASAFVCQAFEQGWPATFAHQDLMRPIRELCEERRVSVHKVAVHHRCVAKDASQAICRLMPGGPLCSPPPTQ